MKKRKKKSEPAVKATATSAAAALPSADGAVVDVVDPWEEPTEVNVAPIPDQARPPKDGASEDPLDAAIADTALDVSDTTNQIPTNVVPPPEDSPEDPPQDPPNDAPDPWDGPTGVGEPDEMAALAARSAQPEPDETMPTSPDLTEAERGLAAGAGVAEPAVALIESEAPPVESTGRLENIIESLIFASDRPLAMSDLKRLLNERDSKKIAAALETLQARHQETGIQLLAVAGGWQLRTHPQNGPWVGKLLSGKPARLSRAMLETLAIVAYRQPITRPEIDEIRGVDCGPVLKTLLERGMVRMIGKKEDVGRPILYGTTPEFLRTFSLSNLAELPTLREFHELGAAEMAKVDAEAPRPAGDGSADTASAPNNPPTMMPAPTQLAAADPDEEDALLAELDSATLAATHASKAREAADAEPAAAAHPPETPEA